MTPEQQQSIELVNKSELEIEQTGWVSDETDDLLIAAELALTEDDINEIEAESGQITQGML